MRLRHLALPCVLVLAAACEPSVPQTASPSSVVTAEFDPTHAAIPLPNDLLLQDPASLGLPPAETELLTVFQKQGGFPNDQEVAITVSFQRTSIDATTGATTNSAPTLDLTTLTPSTLAAFVLVNGVAGAAALDAPTAADYVTAGDHGVLTLHNKGHAPWTPGEYVVALRGGANGIKTAEGDPIYAASTFFLLAQNGSLESQANIGLIAAQTGSYAAAEQLAAELDEIRANYNVPFLLVNQVFPQQELAVMTTFAIAPAVNQVQLDPNRGLVPLPIDLLRDPRPGGKLTPLAACTFASGTLNAAGTCVDSKGNVNSAAGGFAALDGFATTGAILAPTSDLITAHTVNSTTVKLYDLTNPAAPALVDPTTYIFEPCELTSSCSDLTDALSPTVALQPAGATSGDASSVFRTRPLKDATDYAVVISDGVLGKNGKPLQPGTVANILQFTNPLVDATGASQLTGIDNNTAGALEVMREQLVPVLAAAGFGTGHVAMAYTFHTQTIQGRAAVTDATKAPGGLQFAALPYTQAATTGLPGAVTPAPLSATATAAFTKYGVDATIVPLGDINEVLETTITTFDLLSQATGAFDATGATTAETLNVLIATPKPGSGSGGIQTCSGSLAALGAAGLKCAPMVVFHHGLGRSRGDMLLIADTLAKAGMVTVAIDAAKHGERSFCTPGMDSVTVSGETIPICADGGHCTTALPAGAQGDASPPGTCAAGYFHQPVSATCATTEDCPDFDPTKAGVALVSGNYLITSNFFRTRDTFRQDMIDQSQLVRAIAFVPSGAPPTGHSVFDRMAASGVIIDPTRIYWVGQSLGSIEGAVDVATNPRISKAVLNTGGGTAVDLFTNSPAFAAQTSGLLAGLGLQPGTSAYLQFLVIAKTILDPADPINFVGHLQSSTLPNLLPPLGGAVNGSVAQTAKSVLTQAAFCDQTIPNPFNFIFDSTAATGPLLIAPTFGTPGTTGTFQLFVKYQGSTPDLTSCPSPTSGQAPPAIAVEHGFLLDWDDATITGMAQSNAAAFLSAGTNPPSLQVLP